MSVSKELLDAYRWHRHWLVSGGKVRFPNKGTNALDALAKARADIAAGKKRYPHTNSAAVTWQLGRPGIAYVGRPESAGLRLVGEVERKSGGFKRRNAHNTGWLTDPYGDSTVGLCWGVVYQLPGRDSVARFVAGYQFGGYDGGPTLDFGHIYESGSDYSATETEGARDAAYAADSMAKQAAEEERQYQAASTAGFCWGECKAELAAARAELRQLLEERRAARKLWKAGAHLEAICSAVTDKARALLSDMAEKRAFMGKLQSGEVEPLWFFPSASMRAAFNDGAGESVL